MAVVIEYLRTMIEGKINLTLYNKKASIKSDKKSD
ncbi:MAG: hypothetical protein MRERV_39c009 [Mycoplasmataceae bacterium RV_VA103A]|nr:MAG: hypothetical protein MRERV_39c009 [Mycoplasmataceae bacterium RV_VA103A]